MDDFIDLEGLEDKYLATGKFHQLKIVQDLIANVGALQKRVEELSETPKRKRKQV